MSNPQVGLFNVFDLPLWTMPFDYALGLSAALKLFVGGFGTFLLARELRLGFLPGLLAGTAFTFSAYNIVWLGHDTPTAVAVMLPWALLLIERLFARPRLATMLWLAIVVGIALGGGHPGTQVHLLALSGLYAIVRVWLLPDLARADRLRRLAFTTGGLVLGVALMAAILIPEALSSAGTVGTHARDQAGGSQLSGSQMPLDAIKTTLFPEWWGRPSGVILDGPTASGAGQTVNYIERTFYAGIVATLLALLALTSRGGWKRKGPFAMLAFLGLAIPLHMPGLWQLVSHLPPLNVVQNQRLHFAYELAVAILAAFGLRELLDRPAEQRRKLAIPGVAVGLGLLVLISIGPRGQDFSHVVRHFLTGASYEVRQVIELTTVIWFLAFSLAVGAVLVLVHRRPRWRTAIAVGVLLLAVVDGLHFAHGFQPMGPLDKINPPKTPAIAFLQRHVGDQRVSASGYALGESWGIVYGLSDIRGYAPPNPTRRLYSFWRTSNSEEEEGAPFTLGSGLDADAVQVESVMGARYVVVDPGTRLPSTSRLDPILGSLRVVYAGSDATIVENGRAAARVLVPASIAAADSQEDAEARMTSRTFAPASQAIIESDDPAATALADSPSAKGTVKLVKNENARMTLDARLDREGLVVLNDSLTDGWTVKVDGRPATPVRVNSVMRGVVAGPGRHQIVWSYMTPGLKVGALISLLAFLGLIAGAIVLKVRGRSPAPPTQR
jgi:hypothetical protein